MSDDLRAEIIEGLKDGKTLTIWSRRSSALPIALQLESEGLVTQEFVQLDEQSSEVRFRATDALTGEKEKRDA